MRVVLIGVRASIYIIADSAKGDNLTKSNVFFSLFFSAVMPFGYSVDTIGICLYYSNSAIVRPIPIQNENKRKQNQ